jgi:VWFA-related protein
MAMGRELRGLLMVATTAALSASMAIPAPLLAQQAAGQTGGQAGQQSGGKGTTPPAQLGSSDIVAQRGSSEGSFTLKVNADLVLTNVVVRDKKTGEVIQGLKQRDFTVLENGKPQKVTSFDFQNVDEIAALNEKGTAMGSAGAIESSVLTKNGVVNEDALRNHRLIVIFFDLISMQPEDLQRAVEAAKQYVNTKMGPADLVALVSLATAVTLDQDFTTDKKALLTGLDRYSGIEGQGFQLGNEGGTTNGTADTSADYTADESEFNALNTDRELYAIQTIAQSLSRINQKKAMLYFSGGLTRQGIENQASLRAATNAAVRSNLSIYSVDTQGLEAMTPVGDATTGSLRGTAAYNGVSMQNQLDANFAAQETLSTLSADTGGKAFFDTNDFAPAFAQIQRDTTAYYVLGFHSTNTVRDGAFRKLTVKVNVANAKLEYRPGYYAPADYRHSNAEDRERQLEQELASELPSTEVAVYMQALYFRMDRDRYFVPVELIVPGSQIPFQKGGSKDKATLDVIGDVKDAAGHVVANARDKVKLSVDESQQVRTRNIQYSTGFTLAPGKYRVKFVVRENIDGKMGSFEADIVVPDLTKLPLKMSSVVVASQRIPDNGKKSDNPLIRDGQQWVPNVAHVFRQDQHMYFLYEVYDPKGSPGAPVFTATTGKEKAAEKQTAAKNQAAAAAAGVRVLTSIEFLNGTTKVYETPLVEAKQINNVSKDAVAFQLEVPLADLKPGLYTCQVNVIDDTGGGYTFPRLALLVKPGNVPAAPAAPAATPAAPAATPAPSGASAGGR